MTLALAEATPEQITQTFGSLFDYLNKLEEFEDTVIEMLPYGSDLEVETTRTYAMRMSNGGWRIVCACDAVLLSRRPLKGGRGNVDAEKVGRVEVAKQEAAKRNLGERQIRRNAQIFNTFFKPKGKNKTPVSNHQSLLDDKQFYEEALRAPEPVKAIRLFEKEKSENPNFTPADGKRLVQKLKEERERIDIPDQKDYLDPHFKDFLLEVEASLNGLRNRCPRPEFTIRLDGWIRATRFERARTPQKDYEAVRDRVDGLSTTVEEIQEEVYLSAEEIKNICELIVAKEPERYEWRPIGVNTDMARGSREMGIFRKDSPHYEGGKESRSNYSPTVDWE